MFSVIFPGQGSQVVGMGKGFYDKFSLVKDLFNEADETLGRVGQAQILLLLLLLRLLCWMFLLACVVCLVQILKDLCSSLNNVPGETTACIDKQRVFVTLWLSIHSVVSPGTLFREEHTPFKSPTRHITQANGALMRVGPNTSTITITVATTTTTLLYVSFASVVCLG